MEVISDEFMCFGMPEKEVKVGMGLKTKTVVCATRHIQAYFEQCSNKEVADWGKACADCKYVKTCKLDWLARLKPLFKEANVTIQLYQQAHLDK